MLLKLQQMYVYVNYSSLLCPLELCFHDFLKKTLVTSTFIPKIYLTLFDHDEEFGRLLMLSMLNMFCSFL